MKIIFSNNITLIGPPFYLLDYRSSKASHADKSAEDSADFFLAKAIHSMAEKMSDTVIQDNVTDDHDVSNAGDNVGSGTFLFHFQ